MRTTMLSKHPHSARGFSVVEIMVAMALSLLLLGGVIAIFASSRVSYETNDKISRIQENGRFALDQIVRDIRAAGYVGCARAPTYVSSSLNNADQLHWNFLEGPVRGFQATGEETWSPELDLSLEGRTASGSDVLVLRVPRRDAEPLRIAANMTSSTDSIEVAGTRGLAAGDIALAYSCEAQAYFQVTAFGGGVIDHADTGGTPGNVSADINYTFRENAEVIAVHTVAYYVGPSTADPNPDDTHIPTSLIRYTAAGGVEELVEGVEQMQLEFGVDTNGDSVVDSYQTADNVTNWGNVFSVRVGLLVHSLQEYGTDRDERQYQVLDVPVAAPGDRRLREVFAATASFRNRVPVE